MFFRFLERTTQRTTAGKSRGGEASGTRRSTPHLVRFLILATGFAALLSPVRADITVSGNYAPSTSFWEAGGNPATGGYVGYHADGELTITNGDTVALRDLWLGYDSVASGTATVTGEGSELDLSGNLKTGYLGNGAMLVQNGAVVSGSMGFLADNAGKSGTLTIESGGSWNFSRTVAGHRGTATILVQTGGQADGGHLTLGNLAGSAGTLTVRDSGSQWIVDGILRVGATGTGTLNVLDGGAILVTGSTILGNFAEGSGMVTIQGDGSTLQTTQGMTVGTAATLSVLDGGKATVGGLLIIGDNASSTASVAVSGSGSLLATGGDLNVAKSGTATLNVSNGATVNTGDTFRVQPKGTVNLAVVGNDMIVTGTNGNPSTGDFNNNGIVNILASGALEAGTYMPISTGAGRSITGTGTFHAIGGSWNNTTREFTVSEITTTQPADLSGARVMYFDSLVVSFGDGADEQAFGVTELSIDVIEDEYVLGAYDFTTTVNELTFLTFLYEGSISEESFHVWHLTDGESTWTLYQPELTEYTAGSYSFTVDSFSSYAVTVPEPSFTTALLLLGVAAFSIRRYQRRA